MPTERSEGGAEPQFAPLWKVTWKRACPRCGDGALLRGFLTVRDDCPHCGLHLADQDVADGPAVLMTFILGFTVIPLAVVIGFALALPVWAIIVFSTAVLVLTTWLLMPAAKAFWMAIAYRQRIRHGAPGADG